jgi:hypothetical protein
LFDGADRDVEDGRVDLLGGLEVVGGNVGGKEDVGGGFDVLDFGFQGGYDARDGAGEVDAAGELETGVGREIGVFEGLRGGL